MNHDVIITVRPTFKPTFVKCFIKLSNKIESGCSNVSLFGDLTSEMCIEMRMNIFDINPWPNFCVLFFCP